MTVDVTTVVDLGSATGAAVRPLEKRFRGAKVIALDLSGQMLEAARRKRSWLSKTAFVQADARHLPFADASIDVVFSNLLLPWIGEPAAAFAEVSRVLREGGLFAFATLGPDSLLALRQAWLAIDDGAHVNRFPDMHDIGDALVNAGLRDPVLDVDRLSLTYKSSDALFRDLTATGARNSLQQRSRGLVGRQRFEKMTESLKAAGSNGQIALELEFVYGHCWGRGTQKRSDSISVDAANIQRRRR
jgi:malonyl-CoA O-methyltransferase